MLELANPVQRETVNALARQVHDAHVSWRPDLYESTEELYPEARFLDHIRNRELFVARLEGIVVGYVLVKIREANSPGLCPRRVMMISEICVDQDLRNHGIGTEMVSDVRVLAKVFRCTDLQLHVYPQNDEGVAFWQKCGFTIQNIQMQRKV